MIPVTSTEFLFIPVTGPPGTDPAALAVFMALVPEGPEPAAGDWHAAAWISPAPGQPAEAALLIGPGGAAYPAGEYLAWTRLTAAPEAPVMKAGRVRIGDAGT
jgi:hypothetical protein